MGRVRLSLTISESISMLRLALALALFGCALAWQNRWDQRHTKTCPSGQYIARIRSVHHNHYEDRLWNVDCQRMSGVLANKACAWSGYVNSFDAMISYTCPSGKVMTGMDSYHDNGREDRRFRFHCCTLTAERRSCPNGRFGDQCQFYCACKSGRTCNKVTGSCPANECRPGRYGANCQLSDSCYYNNKRNSYLGKVTRTRSGRTCQQWKAQKPHAHTYNEGCDFEDREFPNNYCRVSNFDAAKYGPWCYTTDKKVRWESCNIRSCACPRGFYGENCEKECHCRGNAQCTSTGYCSAGCQYGWAGKDCQARIDAAPSQCQMSGYVNNWDGAMDTRLSNIWAFTGAFSFHDNGREDRRWKFLYCRVDIRA